MATEAKNSTVHTATTAIASYLDLILFLLFSYKIFLHFEAKTSLIIIFLY